MGTEKPFDDTDDVSGYTEDVQSDDLGPEARRIYDHLTSTVIGQDRAARKIARGYAVHHSGLSDPDKPIGALLFSGPTGWGKTEMANQLARHLIGGDTPRPPATSIQCSLFQERHEISRIIGAPPSYIGHGDPYKLAQLKIDEPHFWVKVRPYLKDAFAKAGPKADSNDVLHELYEAHKPYYSVVVFNEFEKAHQSLREAMLHIVDEGMLTGGDGVDNSFEYSTVILTCNVNGREQQDMIEGRVRKSGFQAPNVARHIDLLDDDEREELDRQIYEQTLERIGKTFTPEFVGRFSENIVVFRTLDEPEQMMILDNALDKLRARFTVMGSTATRHKRLPILFLRFSNRFKAYVLSEGVNRRHGIRKLGAAVHRLAKTPLANAVLGGGITDGDDVLLDFFEGKIVVRKRPQETGTVVLAPPKLIGSGDTKS